MVSLKKLTLPNDLVGAKASSLGSEKLKGHYFTKTAVQKMAALLSSQTRHLPQTSCLGIGQKSGADGPAGKPRSRTRRPSRLSGSVLQAWRGMAHLSKDYGDAVMESPQPSCHDEAQPAKAKWFGIQRMFPWECSSPTVFPSKKTQHTR